jgi:hypothetical protein
MVGQGRQDSEKVIVVLGIYAFLDPVTRPPKDAT